MDGANVLGVGIAYSIPDLDAVAQLEVVAENGTRVACVEAPLANGQTVKQTGVSWATAVIAGVALLVSAFVAGLGRPSTAAHVAANALSLFGYFQAQSMISMMGVPLPPFVVAWTQNFAWAMGIIRIKFMQTIFHWYIQATGGSPANILVRQQEVSVQIMKRSVPEITPYFKTRAALYGFEEYTAPLLRRGMSQLVKRVNNAAVVNDNEVIKVTGIERMSYKARIEATNFFMTGMAFYVAFIGFIFLGLFAFKLFLHLAKNKIKSDAFRDFRTNWQTVMKGIIYRILLIGYPQMVPPKCPIFLIFGSVANAPSQAILCPWEFSHRDSPAAIVLAVFFYLTILLTLLYATSQILLLTRHTPTSTLYSSPSYLNRYGYLYISFRSQRFWFLLPLMLYIFTRSLIVALGQSNGRAQAVALFIVEWLWLGCVSFLRPWLDKRTNIINISIAAVNAINSLLVLFFSGITGAGDPVRGVMGIVFFVLNAVFALVLLILVIVTTIYALVSRNPEKRFANPALAGEKGEKVEGDEQAVPRAPKGRDLDGGDEVEGGVGQGARRVGMRESRESSEADLRMERGLTSRDGLGSRGGDATARGTLERTRTGGMEEGYGSGPGSRGEKI